MYLPNWENDGAMESISKVVVRDDERAYYGDFYWQQTEECAGFEVTDACPHRFEEMTLISYTPFECTEDKSMACNELVAYARY